MSIEFLLAFFLIVLGSLYEMFAMRKPLKGGYFWAVGVYLIFLAGFRYYTGPDDLAYFRAFKFVSNLSILETWAASEITGMEAGYLVLNNLIGQFAPFSVLLLVVATVSIVLKFSIIHRLSPLLFTSLLFYFVPYFFFEEVVQIRQGLATAITLYSIRFILERRFWLFFSLVLIAYYFHSAAIVFLPAYYIVRVRVSQLGIVLTVLAGLVATQLGVIRLLEPVLSLLPIGVGEKYQAYLGDTRDHTTILGEIVKVLLVVFILLFDKQAKSSSDAYEPLRNLFLFGVFMYFGFGGGIFSLRLPGFYVSTIYFLVPIVINSFSRTDIRRTLIYFLFLIYSILLLQRFSVVNARGGFGNYQNVILDSRTY